MSTLNIQSGKREFMTLQTYDEKGNQKEYQVMINPETFEKRLTAEYNPPESMSFSEKYSTSCIEFSEMGTTTYDFSLILDGTGIVNPARKDVKRELDALMNVLFTRYGEEGCRPNFVDITYCHETFRCLVKSVVVKYTLFNPDGSPLRATVTCSFSSANNLISEAELENETSEKEKSWFEDFSEVVSTSVKNKCDSLYNLLPIK